MSDLIDRQKAIDAICNAWCGNSYNRCIHPRRKTQFYYYDGCYDVEELEKLPPVQPKRAKKNPVAILPDEQIHCNQCKYYDGVHGVMGHAPCTFWKFGGVLYNWYCSQAERYDQ